MTGRERLVAAARGGELDRKPVITWGIQSQADGVICTVTDLGSGSPDALKLVRVNLPLAKAIELGEDLTALFSDSPESGEKRLAELTTQTKSEADKALEAGADGICFILDGACPAVTSPMEYGGHYLENDREIIAGYEEARFNLVYVKSEEEPFLDFVSDLPAHALGWNVQSSGVKPGELRIHRSGAIAGNDPTADIFLVDQYEQAEPWLKQLEAVK